MAGRGRTVCPRARFAAGRNAVRSIGDADRGGRPDRPFRCVQGHKPHVDSLSSSPCLPVSETNGTSQLPLTLGCIPLAGPVLPFGVLLCRLPAPPWAARPNCRGSAAYLCHCGSVWAISVDTLLFPAGSGNLAAGPASDLSELACQPVSTLTESGLLQCVNVSFISD